MCPLLAVDLDPALFSQVISDLRVLRAKAENKKNPDSFSKEEISLRRRSLIANAIVLGSIVAVIVGLGLLLMNAVAYM